LDFGVGLTPRSEAEGSWVSLLELLEQEVALLKTVHDAGSAHRRGARDRREVRAMVALVRENKTRRRP